MKITIFALLAVAAQAANPTCKGLNDSSCGTGRTCIYDRRQTWGGAFNGEWVCVNANGPQCRGPNNLKCPSGMECPERAGWSGKGPRDAALTCCLEPL